MVSSRALVVRGRAGRLLSSFPTGELDGMTIGVAPLQGLWWGKAYLRPEDCAPFSQKLVACFKDGGKCADLRGCRRGQNRARGEAEALFVREV